MTAFLLAATLCAGLMAGLFLVYAHTVMPGLGAADDRTFVGAFQELDRSVNNGLVFATFFGGTILTGAAIALDRSRPTVWWVAAALGLLIATIAVTAAVHIPLNDAIKAAGSPDSVEVTQVRADFRESWWRAWNLVRCMTSTAAFGCLAWALVLRGRA